MPDAIFRRALAHPRGNLTSRGHARQPELQRRRVTSLLLEPDVKAWAARSHRIVDGDDDDNAAPQLLNDFGEAFWLAELTDACISTRPVWWTGGHALGLPYDAKRRFDLPGMALEREALVAPPHGTRRYPALCSLLQPYAHEYYHVFAEAVPRLIVATHLFDANLQDADSSADGAALHEELKLVVELPLPRFALQLLRLLGIDDGPRRLLDAGAGSGFDLCARRLFLPSPARPFFPGTSLLRMARTTLLRAAGTAAGMAAVVATGLAAQTRPVVVLSRAEVLSRRWRNEAACSAALRAALSASSSRMMRETPVVVYPSSGLPILESIGLFRSARAVVGPHGAGFSNLVLAPDDAVVVEIRPAARCDCTSVSRPRSGCATLPSARRSVGTTRS